MTQQMVVFVFTINLKRFSSFKTVYTLIYNILSNTIESRHAIMISCRR